MNYEVKAVETLRIVARNKPLVHHITNIVVANDTANLTLGLGALPVMADAVEEVEEMTASAKALILNIGTLSGESVEAMMRAGRSAAAHNVPIVLDPVGAGATKLRTETALRILEELPVTVVRGNRGEIGALVGSGQVRGVEAVGDEDPRDVARRFFERFGVVTAVTGVFDVIVGKNKVFEVHNGHPLLARITGSGCMATTAVGVFLTTGEDPALQTALALGSYGVAAERAAKHEPGPGTFRSKLLDEAAALLTKGVDGIDIREVED